MALITVGQNSTDTYAGQDGGSLVQSLPTNNFHNMTTYEPELSGTAQNNPMKFTGIALIPAGGTITAASLDLYEQSASGTCTASIYQILRDLVFTETTWNIWKTANNWTTAGCESAGNDRSGSTAGDVALAAADSAGYRNFTNAAFLTLVQGWYSGGIANYGILLKISAGVSPKSAVFTGDIGADGQRPRLNITISYPSGGRLVSGALVGGSLIGALAQ